MMTTKKSRYWVSERLHQLFAEKFEQAFDEPGKKKRVLDFFLVPGKVQVKLQEETGKMHRVEFELGQFSEEEWERVCKELAAQSIFLANFLAGRVPEEIETVLSAQGLSLPPLSREEIRISCDGHALNKKTEPFAFLALDRLLSRLDDDPFSIFVLRGKGREELLVEVHRQRTLLERPRGRIWTAVEEPELENNGYAGIDLERFWKSGAAMERLSYSIRADELPASLLKRLDPLPLGGVEDTLEPLLEDAYAQIARRAQAYGLELQDRD